jgi:selenocysteine-specific elongation factor
MGDNALKALTKNKKVIRLAHNLFIAQENLIDLMRDLKIIIKKEGYIDIKIFKSHYNLSRKYIICYLEYLDKQNAIVSDGIKRKLVV